MQVSSPIGTRIRQARELRGMQQQELAYQANISTEHLSNIEQDKVAPAYVTVKRLCAILHLDNGIAHIGNMEHQLLLTAWEEGDYAKILRMVADAMDKDSTHGNLAI